ncbi:MAG: 5'/3'-nucleotidase SurE [candidate division NC10 bacterium]|nr:5'/3'-nucleotidase SurE [candidate division NC10 bacterium]
MGREERPLILVSNDDGIGSAGLQALVESLRGLGEVVVVAPDRERSAAGHSLTLSRPLRVSHIDDGWYSVDGTPTDCITLAVMGLLPRRPRLVAAGINHGSNMGDDVTYSGTVSSAIEATLQGIPAFAISVAGGGESDFQSAARFARRLAGEILRRGLPPGTLLNVNVPNLPPDAIQGVAVTRQGRRVYSETVIRKIDPRGKAYYWIGGTDPTWERPGGTDYEAVSSGWISLTPLHLDLTNHRAIDELKGWGLSLNGGPPA